MKTNAEQKIMTQSNDALPWPGILGRPMSATGLQH